MSRPQDIFGASPKTVLNKPFLHVQEQLPTGTDGGTSIAGQNDRVLNTVVTNGIAGASLSANEVTLPAGKYYILGSSPTKLNLNTMIRSFIFDSSDNQLLDGNALRTDVTVQLSPIVSGEITLTTATNIKLVLFTGAQATSGLGLASALGDYEVYADLQIWQLDASVKTPVASSSQSYNGGTYLTGGMNGLELVKTAANTLTVRAGDCMDSTNTVALGSASDVTGVAVPTTINTVQNVFITDDATKIQVDTDVDGANIITSTPGIKLRWIGFVSTNASGDIRQFTMNGSVISILPTVGESILTTGTTPVTIDPSAFAPIARSESIMYFLHSTTATNGTLVFQEVGSVAQELASATATTLYGVLTPYCDVTTSWETSRNVGGVVVYIRSVKLKR